MKVPFIDLTREARFCASELSASFSSTIASGQYINGPSVRELESLIADYIGVDHCVTVGNGSDALVFILRSLGVSSGDEVICPGNSFIASSWAIRAVGATPVFCDVGDDLLIDTDSAISKVTDHTKAILIVHLTGRIADITQLKSFCASKNIHIVEDAAQSFGAFDHHRQFAGSFGVAAGFSLHPLKNFAVCGDGGFITTNDSDIASECRLLRNHGLIDRDRAVIWGFNSRLDELQASLALVKFKYIEEWSQSYNRIALEYSSEINSDLVILPDFRHDCRDVYHNYVIRVPASVRDCVREMLLDHGVETKIHYPIPLHKQECFVSEFGDEITLPAVERLSAEMISLPIYPFLTDAEISHVITSVNLVSEKLAVQVAPN